jgi:hypothetical protein
VFLRGKERKRGFPPIDVDRTREIRHTGTVTDELLAAFAREAAEVHVSRCDGIKEYLTLASYFSQPVPRYHRTKKVALVLLSVAALLTACVVVHFNGTKPGCESTVTIPPPAMAATPDITPLPSWRDL